MTATGPRGARQLAMYLESKERMRSYLLNHAHKFIFINQSGKILSRRTRETKHQIGVAERMASRPRAVSDRTTWLVSLNDEVTRMAQAFLYLYCRPGDGVLDSMAPLFRTIAPSVLAEVNKEIISETCRR